MIDEILTAWSLFGDAWATTLLLSLQLPLCGIALLLRRQVFLTAAIGQAAGLGHTVALASGLGAVAAFDATGAVAGWCAAVLTAWLAMRSLTSGGSSRATVEAAAAAVFLLSASGAMVLLASAPHGLHEVQRLMLSSVLGAGPTDAVVAALVLLCSLLLLAWRGRAVLLWAIDARTAAVYGMRVDRVDLWMGLWLGTTLAFAIQVAGLVSAFGFAILPVLAARVCSRSLAAVLWRAPVIGFCGTAIGLWLAHAWDRPPGQMAVAVQGVALLSAVALGRRGDRSPTGEREGDAVE